MLSKTPKLNAKKTRWALSLTLIGVLIAGAWSYTSLNTCIGLHLGGTCISLEKVDTDAARQKGLSDRHTLAVDHGMLFVFDKADQRCFWMKDMHFRIDMIFLDSQKRVTGIERAVAPETYPETFCHENSQYVIELSQNRADSVKVGDQLKF